MDDTELLRLRAEVSRLRGSEAELARLKNEIASLHEVLARAHSVVVPVAVPDVVEASTEQITRRINNLKQVGLGLRMLADNKPSFEYLIDGRLSPKLISVWGGTEEKAMKYFENATLLVNDSEILGKMESETPWKPVARTINPTPLPDGRWLRLYLLADGSVQQCKHTTAEEIWDGTAP